MVVRVEDSMPPEQRASQRLLRLVLKGWSFAYSGDVVLVLAAIVAVTPIVWMTHLVPVLLLKVVLWTCGLALGVLLTAWKVERISRALLGSREEGTGIGEDETIPPMPEG